MKNLLAALAVVLTACGTDPRTDGFRDGFPRASTVTLKVPGASSNSSPLTSQGTRRDGLEGELATFYSFTRGVTVTVNGAVVATLSLVERITDNPATTLTETTAVWGPYTDALSPNSWRFTVTKRAENDYAYVLEGKGKNEAESAFRAILSGSHVSAGKTFGNGEFLIDWKAANTLPEHDGNLGTAHITYARPTSVDPTSVDATFSQVKDHDSGQLIDATYHFRSSPGQGGSLEFQMNKDFVGATSIELLTVKSRWQETGAGRADVRLTGGDLGSTGATINECWDSNFLSRYLAASYDPNLHWGAETVCAFGTAEYARL